MATRLSRLLVAAALGVTVLVTASGVASAGQRSPASTTTTVAQGHSHQSPGEIYRQELAAYQQKRRAINQEFQAAVRAAQQARRSAMAVATTPTERSEARLNFQQAVSTATQTRDEALVALGSPPVHP